MCWVGVVGAVGIVYCWGVGSSVNSRVVVVVVLKSISLLLFTYMALRAGHPSGSGLIQLPDSSGGEVKYYSLCTL